MHAPQRSFVIEPFLISPNMRIQMQNSSTYAVDSFSLYILHAQLSKYIIFYADVWWADVCTIDQYSEFIPQINNTKCFLHTKRVSSQIDFPYNIMYIYIICVFYNFILLFTILPSYEKADDSY